MFARVRLCVCVCTLLITIVTGASDSPATWIRSQPQQTLHGLMVSINERLHNLENTRWETTLKQVEQRLDSLETTIRRLDSSFQDRLDKLERNLNSKELKDELSMEKMSHKMRDILDSSYDRLNRRLRYTEERLEISFKKVQMSVEGSLNRIEKQQEDIQTEVLEAVTTLEDLKSHSLATDDKLNSTHKAFQQHIQRLMSPNNEELQRISGSLEHLGSRLNNSLGMWGSQNDGPQVGDVITNLRNEINTEATKLTNKVNNMYNDLWRRIISIESLVKDVNRLGNTTQREVLEEVRSLVLTERRDFSGDSQENFMEVALDALERKLQRKLLELGRKLDDRLDTLSATQNLVMDSCFDGGICRGLESRLSQVLEKIFDVYSDKIEGFSNRTFDMDHLVMDMMELMKTQHSQLIRTVTHNTNMVVTLAKDSSEANKVLQSTITQLAEKTDYNFQELQDEVQEISNISGKVCTESDKNIEKNIDQPKPLDLPAKNISQIKIVTFNTTQPTKNFTIKHHDAGVLKITTDDIDILSDNSTLAYPMPVELKLNTTWVVDSSIMQIIGMMSPNLTQNQLEIILQFLNSSVNLENLEAIVQNTEPESEGEAVQNERSDLDIVKNTKTTLLSKNSRETENIYEVVDDLNQYETTETVITQNLMKQFAISMVLNKNKTESKSEEISTDLKDPLKMFALLFKIKHGTLNITKLRKQLQKTSNECKDQTQQTLLAVLQKLCFGEESTCRFTEEYLNTVMRNRLLLIYQTINDVNLYEKIENICNTMTESLENQNDSEEMLTDD